MADNVIILGAGASVDAGIPLLANFVERMWEFAITGSNKGADLSDSDKEIFSQAIRIKNELDGYHGRASFNDRNIEDILSILSFNIIGGNASDKDKLDWMIKAITRTIELSCNVKGDVQIGKLRYVSDINNYLDIYQQFWFNLFDRFKTSGSSFPAIISFNYDLVLERSLFRLLVGTTYAGGYYEKEFPFDGIGLQYHYELLNKIVYRVKRVTQELLIRDEKDHESKRTERGTILEIYDGNELRKVLNIQILKMHGSLNFPVGGKEVVSYFNPTNVVEKPYILPPVINKWVSSNEQSIWSAALSALRDAKNIVIVGYSMPQTDIYMQYFLKAGIGPNINLNKISVFNPVLTYPGGENNAMRQRFGNCFSPQLQGRINFVPREADFRSFVNSIKYDNDNKLFFSV